MSIPLPVQLIPSGEVAIECLPEPETAGCPTATHNEPFHAAAYPATENILVPLPVQLIPSGEVASVLVPCPSPTHKEPFHATLLP
jgi:hypothetical protein